MKPYSIAGYDLAFVVTERAINDQLTLMLRKSEAHIADTQIIDARVSIHLNKEHPDKPIYMEGVIAPPQIRIPPGNGRGSSVELHVPFESGTFAYWSVDDDGNAQAKTADMTGWKLAWSVDLQAIPVDVAQQAGVTAAARALLTTVDQEIFSVEALLLDLEDATYVTSAIEVPPVMLDDPMAHQAFVTAFDAYVNQLRGTNNPFILGFGVTRRGSAPPTAATDDFLVPRQLQYYTSNVPARSPIATLDYFMMTGNDPLPTDPTAGILPSMPVTGGEQGALVISNALIMERVTTCLAANLGVSPGAFGRSGASLVASGIAYQGGSLGVTITPNAGKSTIALAYTFARSETKSFEIDLPIPHPNIPIPHPNIPIPHPNIPIPHPNIPDPFHHHHHHWFLAAADGISLGSATVSMNAGWTDTLGFAVGGGVQMNASYTQGQVGASYSHTIDGPARLAQPLIDELLGLLRGIADKLLGPLHIHVPDLHLDLTPKFSFGPPTAPKTAVPFLLPTGRSLIMGTPSFDADGNLVLPATYNIEA